MKNLSYFRFALVVGFFVLALTSKAYAQNYAVKPTSDYLQTYKDKHRLVLNDIEGRDTLTLAQKLVLYEKEIAKLKDEFRTIRKNEYESKSTELSVTHSCTKGYSGGVKNCQWKEVSAPNSNMYTRKDWIRVEGTNKGTDVNADGSKATLLMTRAGRGRNVGTLYAIFRYRPENIAALIDKETTELFNQVVKI